MLIIIEPVKTEKVFKNSEKLFKGNDEKVEDIRYALSLTFY